MTSPVILLPSLGRPARDFDHVVAQLTRAGFAGLAVEPRATAPASTTLFDLAHGAWAAADQFGSDTVHLVGHAFGNRLARAMTTLAPTRVATLTLLAAGGYVPMEPAVGSALGACFTLPAGSPAHLDAVRRAFFAPGHDPAVWASGWDAGIAQYQRAAVASVAASSWWDAVAPRVLVIQGLDDAVAVPENGRRYAADHPTITTLVELPDAGHALLVEQPDAIALTLLTFLANDDATVS